MYRKLIKKILREKYQLNQLVNHCIFTDRLYDGNWFTSTLYQKSDCSFTWLGRIAPFYPSQP